MSVQILDRHRVLVVSSPHSAGVVQLVVRLVDELRGRGWQIVSAEEVALPPPSMPVVQCIAPQVPTSVSYGPPRNGLRGKVRRW